MFDRVTDIPTATERLAYPDMRPAPDPVLSVIWRARRAIVLCVATFVLAGAFYAYRLAPQIYRTHALVAINAQETRVLGVDTVLSSLTRDAQVLNTQVEMLRSRGLIARLSHDLDLPLDPEFNPAMRPQDGMRARMRDVAERWGLIRPVADPFVSSQAVETASVNAIIRKLDITVEPETLVISVALGTRDPQKSARIVNHLTALYVEDMVARKRAATASATSWLAERVAALEADLSVAEAAADAWTAANGHLAKDRLGDMERQLEALKTQGGAGPQAQILGLEARIAAHSAGLAQGRQLGRQAAALKVQHDLVVARLKETALLDGDLAPDARIISAAVPPLYPASPKPSLILGLALIGGLVAGIAGVLSWAEIRPRYGSRTSLEEDLGLPVLAAIPARNKRSENAQIGHLMRRLEGIGGHIAMIPAPGLQDVALNLRDRVAGREGLRVDLEHDWPLAAPVPDLTLLILPERPRIGLARRMANRLRIAGAGRSGVILVSPGRKPATDWGMQVA